MSNLLLTGRRIGLLTASASRLGGGVFEAVVAQAAMIRAAGGTALVFALDDPHVAADAARLAPSAVRTAQVIGPAQLGFAPALAGRLLDARLDCLHLHGIWMYPSHAARRWTGRTGRPLVISPHGMLEPWITARGRWKKALARAGYERAAWRAARCLHALTRAEQADIARETGRRDSRVIPNAGPDPGPPPLAARPPEVLYLGRIHPKKNLAALVTAWDGLARSGRLPVDARLTIAGWGAPGDVAAVQAKLAGTHPSIAFIGPCFGADKAALLARARWMALPSLGEGLPMAVLEAWAAGMPVLMSPGCNLPQGFAAGAALDCGTEPETIAASLCTALAMPPPAWLRMAAAAHRLATERFAPAVVARQWAQAYAALMEPAP